MQIDYGFTKVNGEGRIFFRNNNSVFYLPNDFSYYFGISELNHFEQPVKIFDNIISSNFEAVKLGKNFAELKINKKFHKIVTGEGVLNLYYPTAQFLDLDYRGLYDFRTEGRFYEITKKEFYEIKCKQGNEFYWVILDGDLEVNQEWVEKYYPFDNSRGDNSSFWAHRIGRIKGEARISWDKNKEEAIKKLKTIKEESFKDFNDLLDCNLSSLVMDERLYAGLPWFFQAWTRDELISLVSYDKKLRKKLLLNYLQKLLPDGRLPNRLPHADLGSADSIGLLAFRYNQNKELFSETEKKKFQTFFKKAKVLLEKNYMIQGLIWNRPNETWMDTNGRKGYCIEIQALYACLLEALNSKELEKFKENVRKKFQNIDNLEDSTVRPNIFLAYYFYKELFEKSVWEEKFHKVIDECWLEWGAFSTISKNHELYHETDHGINDESYHNGNTWYFVNNIAAIAMNDFPKLKKYSKKILETSKKECLSSGLLAACAEISDAKSITSKGCLHQNWSIALLKELISKNSVS